MAINKDIFCLFPRTKELVTRRLSFAWNSKEKLNESNVGPVLSKAISVGRLEGCSAIFAAGSKIEQWYATFWHLTQRGKKEGVWAYLWDFGNREACRNVFFLIFRSNVGQKRCLKASLNQFSARRAKGRTKSTNRWVQLCNQFIFVSAIIILKYFAQDIYFFLIERQF